MKWYIKYKLRHEHRIRDQIEKLIDDMSGLPNESIEKLIASWEVQLHCTTTNYGSMIASFSIFTLLISVISLTSIEEFRQAFASLSIIFVMILFVVYWLVDGAHSPIVELLSCKIKAGQYIMCKRKLNKDFKQSITNIHRDQLGLRAEKENKSKCNSRKNRIIVKNHK